MPKDHFLAGSVFALIQVIALRERDKDLPLVDILLSLREAPELATGNPSHDKGFRSAIDQLFALVLADTP